MARSPQTLDESARRLLASWAIHCTQRALELIALPVDSRVLAALDDALDFSTGELAVADAIRRRGGEAGAAAREATDPATRAAAYAAEQAAAVAHMGAHALGAAGYATKAAILLDDGDAEAVVRRESTWQVAIAAPSVVHALRALPELGSGRGPLGPGRLSTGHVGAGIRAVQRLVVAVSEPS